MWLDRIFFLPSPEEEDGLLEDLEEFYPEEQLDGKKKKPKKPKENKAAKVKRRKKEVG